MAVTEFDNIAYIPDEATYHDRYGNNAARATRANIAIDRGRLILRGNSLEFQGKRGTVVLSGIRALSMTRGLAHVVKVEYGDAAGISVGFFTHDKRLGARKLNQELLAAMQGQGVERELSPQEAEQLQSHRERETAVATRRARTRMMLGGLLLAVGLGATLATYMAASGSSGGTYILAYGPMLVGLLLLIQGIAEWRGLKKP
jgi:hypothetical protein